MPILTLICFNCPTIPANIWLVFRFDSIFQYGEQDLQEVYQAQLKNKQQQPSENLQDSKSVTKISILQLSNDGYSLIIYGRICIKESQISIDTSLQ